MLYEIKETTSQTLVVDLPEDAKVVSVTYHSGMIFQDGVEFPESWTVIYLEPVKE